MPKYIHPLQQEIADHFRVPLDCVGRWSCRFDGGFWRRGWGVDLEDRGSYFLGSTLGEIQDSWAWKNLSASVQTDTP